MTCKDQVGEEVLLNDQMALAASDLNDTDSDLPASELTELVDPETLSINSTAADSLNSTLDTLNTTLDELNSTLANASDDTQLLDDQPMKLSPYGEQLKEMAGMKDTVIQPVLVAPEGSPRQYTVSDLICIKSGDDLTEGYYLILSLPARKEPCNKCLMLYLLYHSVLVVDGQQETTTNYSLPLPAAEDLVFQSERAYISVVGDIMGPALSNIDRLLNMPYGCAEQTMVSLAPNIFILQYLEAINKADETLERRAKAYMKSGRMFMFICHRDFSQSNFKLHFTSIINVP